MNIITTSDPKVPAEYLASQIFKQLELGKKVLWFVTGGSAIAVASEVSKIISTHPLQNLTITITDERYGPVGYPDSNWQQLIEKGFVLPQAKLIPILDGSERIETTEKFSSILEQELPQADYKIGLFGVGPDGHTCGIMPQSEAVNAEGLAFSYQAPKYERITITKKAIEKFDEGIIYMQGQEKWPVVKDLSEKEIDIHSQPAQILKKIPVLTIFSDYTK